MATDQTPLVVVAGATASGKSALGVALAQRLAEQGRPGEIINADSMQLYRGMDIGTAKITAEETQGVPHHLLDVLDITEEASVAAFQQQAREEIGAIRARGNTPVMVGGSGLYIRAATDVIEFPPTDPRLRAELTRQLQDQGASALREELRAADPESASLIKDDRRLVRALEVVRLTGRTFSSYMPQRIYEPALGEVVQLGLSLPREQLHERIAQRVDLMAEQGLLAEVRRLDQQGLRQGRTASRAIGYQQHLQVLDGELTEAEALESTIVATRKFARRQETWFRADHRLRWISGVEEALEAIAA
ncbi:tRNA (adenosine(37)-N6)-dimethylallyltransferase MiaA [Nesterenkonia lacusekhoensis]|uniref:tRNA dimethylallyltransferase n=1 Tax=Nesterenkonia lacusekhoensis TaxID=150832 RepID=A0ABS4T206_9MICC|nr:tRNA dimethylallyltransferase [Nesterenkonia lacusekhoensis]